MQSRRDIQRDIVIVMGDLNAKANSDNILLGQVTGKQGLQASSTFSASTFVAQLTLGVKLQLTGNQLLIRSADQQKIYKLCFR